MTAPKVLGADVNFTDLFSPVPTGVRVRTHTSLPPAPLAEVAERAIQLVQQPDYGTLFALSSGGRPVRLHVYKE